MPLPRRFRSHRALVLSMSALVAATAILYAAAGDVDPSFNPNVTGQIRDHALQPDGKIVIGGTFSSVDGASRIILARLNSDGTNDTTFTSPFESDINNAVNALALQGDGRIVVGGLFRLGGVSKNLVRVNIDGSIDPSFAAPGVNGTVHELFYRPSDGRIFSISQSNTGVSLLNPDGSFNEAIGTFLSQAGAFVVQSDGKVVIGGTNSSGVGFILRFFPNNDVDADDVDPTFNNGNTMSVAPDFGIADMELLPDESILVAGGFTSVDGDDARNHLVRLHSQGGLDTTFDAGAIVGTLQEIAVQPDGKIIAGGFYRLPGETVNRGFARFNADGSVDATFSVPPPDRNVTQFVRSVGVQPDGGILIAGDFTSIGPTPRTFIARLLTDGSNALPVLSNLSVTSPIAENGTATLSGSIADADVADTFVLTVDWSDGQAPQIVNYPAGTTAFSVQHQYLDDNPTATPSNTNQIAVTLADSGGGSDSGSTSLTVNNVPPTLSAPVASPAILTVGGSTTVSGSVSDVGTLDSHMVVINWGDGTAATTLLLAAGESAFSTTHQYNVSGSFAIGLAATDDDGGAANRGTGVTVNPVVTTPNAPTNLTAVAVTKTRIDLAWSDTSNNETGFSIERCNKGKNCTNFVAIAQTASNVTTFADTSVSANTQYRYRVRAFNGDGSSGYTNIATAKTPRK